MERNTLLIITVRTFTSLSRKIRPLAYCKEQNLFLCCFLCYMKVILWHIKIICYNICILKIFKQRLKLKKKINIYQVNTNKKGKVSTLIAQL